MSDKIHCFVRDNASNMVAAFNLSVWRHSGCFLHILQLIVVHSVFDQPGVKNMLKRSKKMVKYFNKSPAATRVLHNCQRDLSMKELQLVRGCKTRWSSYYLMCIRLLEVKPAIIRAETELTVTYTPLTANDWTLMGKVGDYLKPFADLTNMGSSENACISEVIPYVKYLLFLLHRLPRRGVCMLRARLLQGTEQYFRGTDEREHFADVESTELYSLATIMDPRFRKTGFSSQVELAIFNTVARQGISSYPSLS